LPPATFWQPKKKLRATEREDFADGIRNETRKKVL